MIARKEDAAYRYLYGGMEREDQLTGQVGGHYDFGARIYDPRLGRWLSIDPLVFKYPYLTPYHYVGNSPMAFVDTDGRDFELYIDHENKSIEVKFTIYTNKHVNSANQITDNSTMHAQAGVSVINGIDNFSYSLADGTTYSIRFVGIVKPLNDDMDAYELAKQDPSGNSFKLVTLNTPNDPSDPMSSDPTTGRPRIRPAVLNEAGEVVQPEATGTAHAGQYIYAFEQSGTQAFKSPSAVNQINKLVAAHEIGHTLTSDYGSEGANASHTEGGTFSASGFPSPQFDMGSKTSYNFVLNVLQTAGLANSKFDRSKDSMPNVVTNENGKEPDNFKSGTLQKTP